MRLNFETPLNLPPSNKLKKNIFLERVLPSSQSPGIIALTNFSEGLSILLLFCHAACLFSIIRNAVDGWIGCLVFRLHSCLSYNHYLCNRWETEGGAIDEWLFEIFSCELNGWMSGLGRCASPFIVCESFSSVSVVVCLFLLIEEVRIEDIG